jgi:diguanylate cyclase (GGDEF)-like protein/PAS domain S-box-containing protein
MVTDAGKADDAPAAQLIRQIDRHLRLLHITHEAIVCVDSRCIIMLLNQGAEKLFGYEHDELMGKPLQQLISTAHIEQQRPRLSALTRIVRDQQLGFQHERIVCARKNGDAFPAEVSLSQSRIAEQRLYTFVVRDITRIAEEERRLAYRAEHDELTDLPNRNLLNDRLNQAIARAVRQQRRLGVVYLDLDDFKPVNDRYGHEVGDCLLQAVARRLRDSMRQTDTVSRIGGDEFIICLEQIKSGSDAVAAAKKLVIAMKQPFQILGKSISVSASIGVAVYPDHGGDPTTLLRNADQAMYTAKTAGVSPRLFDAH